MMDGASGPAMTSRRPDGQTASERCHLTLELRRLNCWEFRRPLPGDVRFASQAQGKGKSEEGQRRALGPADLGRYRHLLHRELTDD